MYIYLPYESKHFHFLPFCIRVKFSLLVEYLLTAESHCLMSFSTPPTILVYCLNSTNFTKKNHFQPHLVLGSGFELVCCFRLSFLCWYPLSLSILYSKLFSFLPHFNGFRVFLCTPWWLMFCFYVPCNASSYASFTIFMYNNVIHIN